MARPSLADSLRASLNKGAHIETAEKIARGFSDVTDDIEIEQAFIDSVVTESLIIKSSQISVDISSNVVPITSNQPIQPQTEEVSSYHTLTPSDGQTVEQSDSITVKQLDSTTVLHSNGTTVTQSDSYTVRPPVYQTVGQSNSQTVRPLQPQTVAQYQTHHQTPMHYVPLEVLNLAYNQACVLEALIDNKTGLTNYRAISDQTHIGIPSVREALSRLVVKGFMHKPLTVKNAAFQGFSYILNKALCDHFIAAGGLGQENYKDHQTIQQTVRPSDNVTVTHTNGHTAHSSSEFIEDLKPATTLDYQSVQPSDSQTVRPSSNLPKSQSDAEYIRPSDGFILTGAVGAYWEEEGLGEGQARKWCLQFETAPEQMRQQLDWARFDLEANGRRKEVKKDTISWFFGHLRTTGGCFPRPVNYKSPAEIRAESIEKDMAQEQEAKARLLAAEAEQKFQRILANPESMEYVLLYNQVNSFAKEEQGIILEHALRDIFMGEGRAEA